jgi:hypothetical protein
MHDTNKVILFPEDNEEQVVLASESTHWYLPDGTPFYTVPRKSKGKNGEKVGDPRPVTIRDARPVNAVPSVTTVIGCWDKPALNTWRERNVFEATRQLLVDSCGAYLDYPIDDFWQMVRAEASKPREVAADRGTILHAEIEKWLLGRPYNPEYQKHIDNIVAVLVLHGIDLSEGESEKSFAHKLGFGGKVDWHRRGIPAREPQFHEVTGQIGAAVVDFKSKERIDKKDSDYGYINHYAQIASYAVGLGLSLDEVQGINVFVGVEDAKVVVLEWTKSDLKRGWDFFYALLRAWKIDKKYYPKLA